MNNQAIWEEALAKRIENLERTVSNLYAQVQSMDTEIFLLQTELAEIKDEDADGLRPEQHTGDSKTLPSSQPSNDGPSDGMEKCQHHG